MATKKKVVPATKPMVLASVQFVQELDGTIGVRVNLRKNCPKQTADAARIMSHLLFKECEKNGAVAVNLNGKVVLCEKAAAPGRQERNNFW